MRDMTGAMESALAAQSISPLYLLEAEFSSGTVYLWTGIGEISWDGKTWLGAGSLIEVSQVQETTTTSAAGLTVSMSGIPSEMLSIALGEHYQGRPARMWLGAMTEAGLIAEPLLLFSGRMDTMSIEEGAETSTISVNVENRLVDLQRAREVRYTHEAQRSLFPNDKGFEFVSALQNREINWGR